MKQEENYFEITKPEIQMLVSDYNYRIPISATLQERLPDGIFLMKADVHKESRIDIDEPDAFFHFIRENADIKVLFYSYRYYEKADLEMLFKLSEADRIMFASERDHSNYLDYEKNIMNMIDMHIPKFASFYVIHDHILISCTMDDPWLEQIQLPNAQILRDTYQQSPLYSPKKQLHFQFTTPNNDIQPSNQIYDANAKNVLSADETASQDTEKPSKKRNRRRRHRNK